MTGSPIRKVLWVVLVTLHLKVQAPCQGLQKIRDWHNLESLLSSSGSRPCPCQLQKTTRSIDTQVSGRDLEIDSIIGRYQHHHLPTIKLFWVNLFLKNETHSPLNSQAPFTHIPFLENIWHTKKYFRHCDSVVSSHTGQSSQSLRGSDAEAGDGHE